MTRGLSRFRLPRRSVRLRLTAVYVMLFLVSGACLLTITYVLVEQNAGPPLAITTQVQGRGAAGGRTVNRSATAGPGQAVVLTGGQSCLVARTAQEPDPGQLTKCVAYLSAQEAAQRRTYLDTLLGGSAIALAAMTVAAVGIGWVTAGRMLRPLRTMTWAARSISASNLNRRLALTGPDDELKELGDTFDGLLARLEAAFDAQRQFVANASHELRTPLARQRTLVEVALAEPEPTVDGLRATCDRVLAAGQQQERLIEALLTLARSQRGLDRWEPIDLAAVMTDAVAARREEAARQQLRMDVSIGAAAGDTAGGQCPAAVFGDARLAERLLANLLDNAIRHNYPGGWVAAHLGADRGQTVLRIANSGPVIAPGEVPRLFAPFQRLGSGRGGQRDGHGLGLSIVSAIGAAHSADVRADALPAGGLAVQVRFPPPPAVPPAPGCG